MGRVALYARVSTNKDQSVETQLFALRDWAVARGHEVVAEYTDEGISGAKGRDKRPALDAMMKEAARGKFDMVAANRAVAKQFARRQLASRIAKFRLTIVESSRGQREELLRPLAKVATDAAFLMTLCQSPAQMLGRVALGDARRTQYQTQLEGAGPVELETAAITAIATRPASALAGAEREPNGHIDHTRGG